MPSLRRTRIGIGMLGLLCLATAGASADVLSDHFGVTPQLDLANGRTDTIQGGTSYHFLAGSLAPTKHTGSAAMSYVVDDWWGAWSDTALGNYTSWSYTGQGAGTFPSGEEPYDVEAMYFDCDDENIYIAIITSFGPSGGHVETRYNSIEVVGGDLALDISGGGIADGFSYDYGVNMTDDAYTGSGDASINSSTVGTSLYQTSDSDWYVGTSSGAVDAGGEMTNFNPSYGTPSYVDGSAEAIDVSYTLLSFADGNLEGLADTYSIGITIPRSLLPELEDGDVIGIGWVEGCRNDGNATEGVIRLDGTVPEPTTLSLIGLGGLTIVMRRKRRNSATTQ